jgi:hypothetical protein
MFRTTRLPLLAFTIGLLASACAATGDDEPRANAQDELQTSASASGSSAAFAAANKKLLDVFGAEAPQRGGDVFSVPSVKPIENALKGYVAKAYSDDPDLAKGYKYKVNSGSFNTDTQEAGTISNSLAWRVISGDITDDAKATAKAKAAFDDLVGMGAVFGYDAGQESGCAAPTDFLLVIDPNGKKVFTIELTPCDES